MTQVEDATAGPPSGWTAGAGGASPQTRAAVRAALAIGVAVAVAIWAGLNVLVVIVGVVLLVTIHEFGHYVMARRGGMAVTEFFIGFGPRIFAFERNGTTYGLKAIPAGAYVKVPGMYNIEEVEPEVEPFTYRQARFIDKFLMVLGGPMANLVTAVVLLFVLHAFTGTSSDDNWEVGAVVADTAAAEAGLQPGDRIVSIDGVSATTFDDMREVVADRGGAPVPIVVERGAADAAQSTTLEATIGDRVGEVADGSPAAEMGLQTDDVIVELDGQRAESFAVLIAASAARPGEPAELLIERNAAPCRLNVTLGPDLSTQTTVGFLGVGPGYPRETTSVPSAVGRSFADFGRITSGSVSALGRFFSPGGLSNFFERVVTTPPSAAPADDPCPTPAGAGAIGEDDEGRILSIYGAVRLGSSFSDLSGLLSFFALINIFLGIFNLIPLLPLDGGHAVLAIYERIRSRRGQRYHVDLTRVLPVAYFVVTLLVMVGLGSLYMDIADPIQ